MKLAFGTHRTVILIGRYAIKVPAFTEWRIFLHGLLANIQEAQFSVACWPELCPVVFRVPGGFLNVMLRAEPLSRQEFLALDYDLFAHKEDYWVPVENKQDSFGLLNGNVVAVDYGS